eukprot:gb/GECG01008913.1/.p1 GENE.gb/GECG01008913.1/~~gb/GECG01008913.1/.p1  ORF type:complete len:113 (+),score=12.78 gb/GECG01008913.1/:1-339(+)
MANDYVDSRNCPRDDRENHNPLPPRVASRKPSSVEDIKRKTTLLHEVTRSALWALEERHTGTQPKWTGEAMQIVQWILLRSPEVNVRNGPEAKTALNLVVDRLTDSLLTNAQ